MHPANCHLLIMLYHCIKIVYTTFNKTVTTAQLQEQLFIFEQALLSSSVDLKYIVEGNILGKFKISYKDFILKAP